MARSPASRAFDMRSRRGAGLPFSRRFRFVALLAFVAFLSGWTIDSLGLHDCPHHDLPGHHGGSGVGEFDGGLEKDGGPEEAHHHHPPSDRGDEGAHHHDGPCICLGACAGAVPVAIEVLPTELHPAPTPIRAADAPRVVRAPRTAIPYILPWSTAPPLR